MIFPNLDNIHLYIIKYFVSLTAEEFIISIISILVALTLLIILINLIPSKFCKGCSAYLNDVKKIIHHIMNQIVVNVVKLFVLVIIVIGAKK